ncbi:hypothetical protein Tco_0075676, partial [Tanacetum coccineum]
EADLIKMERRGKRRVKAMRFPSSGNPRTTSLCLRRTWPNQVLRPDAGTMVPVGKMEHQSATA